jgi:hypothetical protein
MTEKYFDELKRGLEILPFKIGLYLNKNGLRKLQKHARSKCAVFAPLLRAGFCKHARSKCAVFAPLLRVGFSNFFANHFPFGICHKIMQGVELTEQERLQREMRNTFCQSK